MASLIGYGWFGIGLLGIVDAFRHSASDWAYADRNRPFWVVFMFFFGPIMVPLYMVAVRAQFPRTTSTSDRFIKK
jgi:hypothetical protein